MTAVDLHRHDYCVVLVPNLTPLIFGTGVKNENYKRL